MRKRRARKRKALSAGVIGRHAAILLRMRRCEVWRQNNLAAAGRTFIGRRGVPDWIGFHLDTGVFVGCEVKAKGDKLSPWQKDLLGSLLKAGGLAFLAVEDSRGNVVLKDYADELKNPEY